MAWVQDRGSSKRPDENPPHAKLPIVYIQLGPKELLDALFSARPSYPEPRRQLQ